MADAGDEVPVADDLLGDQHDRAAECEQPPDRPQQQRERAQAGQDAVADADVQVVHRLGAEPPRPDGGDHHGLREQGRQHVPGGEHPGGPGRTDPALQRGHREREGPEVRHPDRAGHPETAEQQRPQGVLEQVVPVGAGELLETVHQRGAGQPGEHGGGRECGEVAEREGVAPGRGQPLEHPGRRCGAQAEPERAVRRPGGSAALPYAGHTASVRACRAHVTSRICGPSGDKS